MEVELVALDEEGRPDVLQSDSTGVAANTPAPKWNAIFDFAVPSELVEDAVVVFKAWDTRGIGRAFLGQVGRCTTPSLHVYDRADTLLVNRRYLLIPSLRWRSPSWLTTAPTCWPSRSGTCWSGRGTGS